MLTFLASEAGLKCLHKIVQLLHAIIFWCIIFSLTIQSFLFLRWEGHKNSDLCKSIVDLHSSTGRLIWLHQTSVMKLKCLKQMRRSGLFEALYSNPKLLYHNSSCKSVKVTAGRVRTVRWFQAVALSLLQVSFEDITSRTI